MGWLVTIKISKIEMYQFRKKAQSHTNFLVEEKMPKAIGQSTVWQTLNKGYYTVIYRINSNSLGKTKVFQSFSYFAWVSKVVPRYAAKIKRH